MTIATPALKTMMDGAEQAAAPRARILLVDDDERNLLALSEVLEPLAEIVTATSGRAALRELLRGDFAVILLDVFMPGIDGYETAKLIREREQTAKIPIIFLSAVNKETEHLMRGYAMGAVDYVFKPVDPIVLKSKVSVFVDLYEMRRHIEDQARAERELREAAMRAETERLTIERELQQSRLRQAAIVEAVPLALYEATRTDDGHLVRRFVGGDIAKLVGDDAADVTSGKLRWEDRIPFDDAVNVARRTSQANCENASLQYRWNRSDGEVLHVIDQSVCLDAEGHHWVGTLIDVTAQRRLEEQLVQAGKMDAIGQLTGGVAHDFNNLLAAILGGLSLLEKRIQPSERDRFIIDQIRHAAEQGAELVRRMMAFARKQDLTPGRVNPRALCDSVAGLVEHTLGGTVTVDWDCADDCRHLFIDQSQLELALINLLINARDAMPGGGRIAVKVDGPHRADHAPELQLPRGEFLRIQVKDEGQGIPAELVEKVMEPFFTTKDPGKGTGLGLSMVAGFVQQSGGRIRIDSEPGSGTTIELYLPAAVGEDEAEAAADDSAAAKPVAVRTLLLVDDDDIVRTVLAEQLRDLGVEVTVAASGRAALEILEQEAAAFDFMLTDFAMPGLNGAETATTARRNWPDLRAAIMTGYVDEQLIGHRDPSIPVLRKPLDFAELERVLAGG